MATDRSTMIISIPDTITSDQHQQILSLFKTSYSCHHRLIEETLTRRYRFDEKRPEESTSSIVLRSSFVAVVPLTIPSPSPTTTTPFSESSWQDKRNRLLSEYLSRRRTLRWSVQEELLSMLDPESIGQLARIMLDVMLGESFFCSLSVMYLKVLDLRFSRRTSNRLPPFLLLSPYFCFSLPSVPPSVCLSVCLSIQYIAGSSPKPGYSMATSTRTTSRPGLSLWIKAKTRTLTLTVTLPTTQTNPKSKTSKKSKAS
ncbi:hypothetical protein EV361DRAFT_938872 [Lentinula raphanica]|nr:hypothetical protein F5880DRAFT_1575354 [Lentinula raphanica]KAJ3965496.1 hypothetical protein EV361DRAFT_938872 [Lentinula raphanica]